MMDVEEMAAEPKPQAEERPSPPLTQQNTNDNSRSESPDQKPFTIDRLKKGASPTVRNQNNLSEWIKERQRKIQESKKSSEGSAPMFTTATTTSFDTGQEKAEKRYQEAAEEEERIDLKAAQNEEELSENEVGEGDVGEVDGDGQHSRMSNTVPETK